MRGHRHWQAHQSMHGHGHHGHGHRHGRRRRLGWGGPLPWWFGRYIRARLHRRIFLWFGLSILLTGLVVMVVSGFAFRTNGIAWSAEVRRLQAFAGDQFARVWDDPPQRDALANSMARDLAVTVTLSDAHRQTLQTFGEPCQHMPFTAPVMRGAAAVGYVQVCINRHPMGTMSGKSLFPLAAVFIVLWAASGRIARSLARPLVELAHVAQDLGAGRLSSRVNMTWEEHGEIKMLAIAINDMASRIERQISDQRELLAAVSHELRTPLGHLRLLVELARVSSTDAHALEEIDREVMEIDKLVGQLLATSRLDFATLTVTRLDGAELARRALERAGLPPALLALDTDVALFDGDATLMARALANLLDNARKHGAGVERLRVKSRPGYVAFEVEDRGAGFAAGDDQRAFDAFFSKATGSERDRDTSLGLGLNLVKRTAEAHGGVAFASNRPDGGARVGFEVPVTSTIEPAARS